MSTINKNYIKLSEFRFIPNTIIYYFWFNKNCFNEQRNTENRNKLINFFSVSDSN